MRLIFEGGGVRAAFSAAIAERIHEAGLPVEQAVGASTGSMVAAYYAAGLMIIPMLHDAVLSRRAISRVRAHSVCAELLQDGHS